MRVGRIRVIFKIEVKNREVLIYGASILKWTLTQKFPAHRLLDIGWAI